MDRSTVATEDLWSGDSVRLVATDIDGTMLRSDGSLSARVRSALHQTREAGIHVVPSTGRPTTVAVNIIEATGLGGIWVFANGAVTRNLDLDSLIRGFWMDRDLAIDLITSLREVRPRLRFAVEFEKTLIFERPFDEVAMVSTGRSAVSDVVDRLKESEERVQKVLICEPGAEIDELLDFVDTATGKRAAVTYSGLPFLEMAPEAVTKATALSLLAADLEIPSAHVAAFGDHHNDISMLQWAGQSFAMGNAKLAAKAAASTTIASNDEDGLALALESLLASL